MKKTDSSSVLFPCLQRQGTVRHGKIKLNKGGVREGREGIEEGEIRGIREVGREGGKAS